MLLFQRLNSGGANLSEQELRNCIVVSINKPVFEKIKAMAATEDFLKLTSGVGEERAKRQYLIELVTRCVVLRNYPYEAGLDVHEYLDKGIMDIAGNNGFNWEQEELIFVRTMKAPDPPPMNWSTLRYAFRQTGGPKCRGSITSLLPSWRSCARSMF